MRPTLHFTARVLIAVASIVLATAVTEAGLRLDGFEYHLLPSVQFGWPTPEAIQHDYNADPDLLWVKPDFEETLAQARKTHPAIVFTGDSCTEWGSYPSRTLRRLDDIAPDLATGVKFGAAGWSSQQGLILLRRDILPLKPRVVTFYFGWNDHWVALGPTDPELTAMHRFQWLENHFRLMQLVERSQMHSSRPMSVRPNRVPIERYAENLTAMVRESQQGGVRPVLITAPGNHVRGAEPAYLKERHVRSLDEVVPLHEAYIEVTRRVARATGATLCDAAEVFSRLPPPSSTYFRSDGIHLMDAGDQAMADLLSSCIVSASR